MEIVRSVSSTLIQILLAPFAGLHPMLSLIPLSILLGVGMLLTFRLTSNQSAIQQRKRRIQAYLYELRLFVDEPKLIWKAQSALLRENARYLGLMLVPAIVMIVPLALVLVHLEAFYGSAPLRPGAPAVVTVQLKGNVPGDSASLRLDAPDGVVVETPAVRAVAQRQVSWRVRPSRPVSDNLRITIADETATKSIVAGSGPEYISRRRVSSSLALLEYPAEEQLNSRAIEWIELELPPAEPEWLGIRLHWLIWLLIISMAAAFILRRRFGVTF